MARLTTFSRILITLLIVGGIGAALYYFGPGIKIGESKQLESISVSDKDVNNVTTSAELPLPSAQVSSKVANKPLTRIGA